MRALDPERPSGSPGAGTVLRLLLGLTIGFVGAFVTLQAIDRFGSERDAEPFEIAVGEPDFDAYCARDDARRLRGIATTADPDGWRCVGTIEGLWTTEPIAADEVCRWEHGPVVLARLVDAADPDSWVCVSPP